MDKEWTMEPLAKSLKALMEARGISVTELWTQADLKGPSAVYRYLSGERGKLPNSQLAESLEKMAPVLGVTPEYFLEWRAWKVREIVRRRPQLVKLVYDVLVEADRAMDREDIPDER